MYAQFCKAKEQHLIVHDTDVLETNRSLSLENFRASRKWVLLFKKKYNIVSRKITKFITRTQTECNSDIYNNAKYFVQSVKLEIDRESHTLDNVYNTDQSGFNLEFHSGRLLTYRGVKHPIAHVQSVSATTHSYTIQPLISGNILSPMLIVLKEAGGTLGPRVQQTMFRGKVTK